MPSKIVIGKDWIGTAVMYLENLNVNMAIWKPVESGDHLEFLNKAWPLDLGIC